MDISLTLLFVSLLAGVLTVLAPCILPLLPIVIGSSVGARSKATPYIVIGSLATSILIFTYLLKASTIFITIPQSVWSYLSGGILLAFGLILLFPTLWERLRFVNKGSVEANKLVGAGHQKKSAWGDVLVGAALGPVFSSCSPTYFVILATVLPASFFLGTIYLLTYILGLVIVLVLIAILGQSLIARLQGAADSRGLFKKALGGLFILVGVLVFTGYDKKIETWVLDQGYLQGVIQFESELLETIDTTPETESDNSKREALTGETDFTVPAPLARFFPNTDFSQADPALADAISGGPPKDGIPSIDNPTFVPLAEVTRPDSVQAIVLAAEDTVRVYPYNILTWHEIVNDTVNDTPVAITFCPLCGSAIVFNRTLPTGQVAEFGVSGSLLESNMIMYDRATENLWQQSTGKTLAGSLHPAQLELVEFQLLTLGEVRNTYPNAQVLSEETGHNRDYGRNPYAGYESNDRFVFDPSNLDTTFDAKAIMVVFKANDTVFAAPWDTLRESGGARVTETGTTYTLALSDKNELTVSDSAGTTYPFFFEMWFSVAVQNDDVVVIEP